MSLLETLFTDHPREISETNIKEIVQDLSQDKDISTCLADLASVSKKYPSLIANQALPILFQMLQDNDKYKQFITQILSITLDILNGDSAPSNCLNVLEQKNSITILLQYTNSTSPQNRILVLRILSQLAIHQLELLQSVLISTEDHLPNLLSLIHDKNKIILQEFLDFVCVSVENNPNFQQIVAFNILDSLVSLLRQGNDKTFSALIAVLRNNSISQTMFYSSGYIDAVAPYVRSKTSSSLSFLRSLFQDESFPKHQKNLLSTTFFAALLEVSIDDLRFLEILSLATHNSKELTDKVTEKGTLLEIVQKMIENLSDEHLKFVQDFDGKSDICKLITENFTKINENNLSIILRICEVLDISDHDCRIVFAKKGEKGESFLNKVLQMLDGPNMSTILVFLAVECWECNSACYSFFEDSTKIGNTYKYLEIVCAAENITMNSLSLFSSYMILASLMQFSDNYIPNVVSLMSKESLISKIVQLRSTVQNEFKDDEIAQYLIKISFNFVGDSPKIEQIQPEIKEEPKVVEVVETKQEETPKIEEEKPKQEIQQEITIIPQKQEINNDIKQELKQVQQENEEENDSNLYRKFIIEKSKRQEAERRCEDLQNQLKYNMDEESKRITSIKSTFSSELEKKQNLIHKLESQIDTITISSQKEISDLKKKQMLLENQNIQEMSKLKSDKNSEILKKCFELKDEVNKFRSELELFESSNKALMDSKLDELSEMRKFNIQIQEENKNLKFRISQLERQQNFNETEQKRLNKKINELQNEKEALESKCTDFQQELLVIRNSFRSGNHENLLSVIDSQRTTIVSMTSTIETQKSLIYDLKQQYEDNNSSKSQISTRIHELETAISTEKAERKKLENLLAQQKEETQILNETVKILTPQRDAAVVDAEECQVKIRILEIQIKSLISENEDLKKQIGKDYEKDIIIINGDSNNGDSSVEIQHLLSVISEKEKQIEIIKSDFENQMKEMESKHLKDTDSLQNQLDSLLSTKNSQDFQITFNFEREKLREEYEKQISSSNSKYIKKIENLTNKFEEEQSLHKTEINTLNIKYQNEINTMKNKYETEIDQLDNENTNLKTLLKNMKKELDISNSSLSERETKLRNELNENNQKISELKSKISVFKQNEEKIKKDFKEKTENLLNNFTKFVEKVNQRLVDFNIPALSQNVENLMSENKDLKKLLNNNFDNQKSSISETILYLKKQISQIKSEVSQNIQEIKSEISKSRNGLRERIIFFLKLLYKYKSQIISLKKSIEEKNSIIYELSHQNNTLNTTISQLNATIHNLSLSVNQENEKSQKISEKYQKISEKISEKEREITELKKQLNESRNKLSETEKILQNQKSEFNLTIKSQLLESNNRYELIISDQKSKISEYEKIFQKMKSKIEEYEKKVSNSYEEISKYKNQIEESNMKLDECEKQLKQFSSSDKHRINILEQEIESKTQRLKEITQLSIQQNQKLTESMNRISELEKSRENSDDLKRRIEILENQADVFRANERRLQRRISELKDKLGNNSKYEEMYSELEKKFKESQEMAKSAIKRLTIELDRKALEEATESPYSEEMESLRQSLSEKEKKIKDLERIVAEEKSKVEESDENMIEVFDIAKFEELSDSEFRKKALTIIGKLWLEKVSKSQAN